MTINVGLDYDEPIFDWFDNAHKASVHAGLAAANGPVPTQWASYEQYGCTREEWVDVLDREVLKGQRGMYGLPLDPKRVEQVKRLYTLGYGVHIVTARGQFGDMGHLVKMLTKTQMINAGLPYDTLHFTRDKARVAQELRLDYFLDDNGGNVDDVIQVVPETYLLNKPWNVEHPWNPRKRVDSLEEFVDLVTNRHGDLTELSVKQRNHILNNQVLST